MTLNEQINKWGCTRVLIDHVILATTPYMSDTYIGQVNFTKTLCILLYSA